MNLGAIGIFMEPLAGYIMEGNARLATLLVCKLLVLSALKDVGTGIPAICTDACLDCAFARYP